MASLGHNELMKYPVIFFSAGNDDQKFSMHVEEGNIVIAGQLDWETTREYNLTVQATDGVHRASAVVRVTFLVICLWVIQMKF